MRPAVLPLRFWSRAAGLPVPLKSPPALSAIRSRERKDPFPILKRSALRHSALSPVLPAWYLFSCEVLLSYVIESRDASGKIVCFIICLKRIPRFFVVWHGKSSVWIILSELIIPFFRLFFKDEKCRQKHAEFISEFCVFLFALSIGRFRWILENILMRSCLLYAFFLP